MNDMDQDPPASWTKPTEVMKMRRMKSQKRALQDRLFDHESPSKKAKRHSVFSFNGSDSSPLMSSGSGGAGSIKTTKPVKNRFRINSVNSKSIRTPPPPDETTCDDSTLLDLLGIKPLTPPRSSNSLNLSFSNSLEDKSQSHSSPSPSSSPANSVSRTLQLSDYNYCMSPVQLGFSPIKTIEFSPPLKLKPIKRRILVPTKLPASPSFSPKKSAILGWNSKGNKNSKRQLLTKGQQNSEDSDEADCGSDSSGYSSLCLDWSLKTTLKITSKIPFGWNSTHLKTSEESSGISSFVRCIDLDPSGAGVGQLDTSLGAQFHQCSLYWQHPSLPTFSLFPRNQGNLTGPAPGFRLDENITETMHSEWIEAFRSAFQLLKARQCPYFYMCTNQLTILFCSAGTQGDEQIQVYITPATNGLRDALKAEGIHYSMPYHMAGGDKEIPLNTSLSPEIKQAAPEDSDDESDNWLEQMGLSQNLNVVNTKQSYDSNSEKNKSSLIMVSGSETQGLFNFLINARSFLYTTIGALQGIPPTILSPVAFHYATLKTLKVKQYKSAENEVIELNGPILPHVLHMLSFLLNKTVCNWKVSMSTLGSTIPFNLYAKVNSDETPKPSIFELQNLSDCGLKKQVLETFCRRDHCCTIREFVQRKNGGYKWK